MRDTPPDGSGVVRLLHADFLSLDSFQKRDPMITNPSALRRCIALMGNLSAEAAIRRQMSASEEFREACLGLMVG